MSAARKSGERFRFPIRVYYEDTDAAGVVYYANYLKYMERARTEWLSSLGVDVTALATDVAKDALARELERRLGGGQAGKAGDKPSGGSTRDVLRGLFGR